MATIDWPTRLIPQTAQLSLRKAGAQFVSPFNGTLQALEFIAERWVLSANLAPQFQHDPHAVATFCNRMAGGVERVRVWPFHTRGVPRGTMRGNVTLRIAAARGDTVLRLAGALAPPNLINAGGMEVDAVDDGFADGWSYFGFGAYGTIGFADEGGNNSPRAQSLWGTAMGPLLTDGVGMFKTNAAVVAGRSYTLAVDTRDNGQQISLEINWKTAAGVFISQHSQFYAGAPGVWTRRITTAIAPATAALADVYISGRANPAGPGFAAMRVDNVQLQEGTAATAFSGAATLLAGDYIGAGGQLFQVAADVQLLDNGEGDIPVINRARGTIAAGSPVTWNRPTCEMVLPAMQAGPVHRPGVIESTALDLVEVW